MAKVECVFDACGHKVGLGEGPHWDDRNQRLLWLDIFDRNDESKGKTLHIYNPATGSDKAVKVGEPITSVIPRQNSCTSVAVTFKRNFAFLDIETNKLEIVKYVDDERPKNRFNDGKCDALGRYWAGTMGPEDTPAHVVPEQGSMYCLEPGAEKVVWKYNEVSLSNGIGWSGNNETMYHVDSSIGKVWAFDFDLKTGSVENKRTAVDIDPKLGVPDGLCVDTEDKLWVAVYFSGQEWNYQTYNALDHAFCSFVIILTTKLYEEYFSQVDGWKVIRYDPATGSVMTTLHLPVSKVTSCCWGGKNLDELYVTSARECLTDEQVKKEPLAGSVFKVTGLNCKGRLANTFNG